MVNKRYARANNPWVEGYDPSKLTNYIMYLDANNLYGWALSRVAASHAHSIADHENERNFEDGLDSAARGAQQLPTRARKKGAKPRADVGVPTEADGGSESGPIKQREAGADSGGQRKICGLLHEPAEVPQPGVASE